MTARPSPSQSVARYVAIGDSQTEGLHDAFDNGELRGWADRLAERLASKNPDLLYANLAVRGRLTAQIRAEQLAPALSLKPDLLTAVAGVNDVIRPGSDLNAVADELEAIYRDSRSPSRIVMGCTFPAPPNSLSRFVVPRVRAFNTLIRTAAARHNVLLVELEDIAVAADPRLWSRDRIHLNRDGHARLAAAFAAMLEGLDRSVWTEPLPPASRRTFVAKAGEEIAWLARFVGPKIIRTVRGRSSGDGRMAKRPALLPVTLDHK